MKKIANAKRASFDMNKYLISENHSVEVTRRYRFTGGILKRSFCRCLTDLGEPVVSPLHHHLGLDLLADSELLEILLVFDRKFHSHRRHPALDLFILYGGQLGGWVYA